MTSLFPHRRRSALAWLCCAIFVPALHADSLTIFPVADATMIELRPSNSIGSASWITAGITQNGNTNRALLKFDVAAALPAGSTIIDVGVNVWVTRQPVDGYAEALFSLRRMLRPWGEGANPDPPSSPGLGLPALPGDATWTHAFHDTNAWTIPGGLEGVDYSASFSSAALISGVRAEAYFFESGGAIADVQLWLDHPEQNFGWMLKSESEEGLEARFTARRFGSRELQDEFASPQLIINYLPPITITNAHVSSNRLSLSFATAFGYSYRVEARGVAAGTNAWTTLTNYGLILSPGPRTATDSLTSTQRFYRVRRD